MKEESEDWSLTVCFVPETYPREKSPKDIDTYLLNYVPKQSSPGVALDGLINQAKKDAHADAMENSHVAWMQLLYHNEYDFDERNPDWSYSYQFQRSTKVWMVQPFDDAADTFRTMVMREADGPVS